MSKTVVLPGITSTVKIPTFANMIDSIVPFTTIWNRPASKQEVKALVKELTEIKQEIYQVLFESRELIEKLTNDKEITEKDLDDSIDEIKADADKKVLKINKRSKNLRDKWLVGFEGLKDIECNETTLKVLCETPGYDESIGTALSDLAKRKVRKAYDMGN